MLLLSGVVVVVVVRIGAVGHRPEEVVEAAIALLGLAAVALDPFGHQVEDLRFEVHRPALGVAGVRLTRPASLEHPEVLGDGLDADVVGSRELGDGGVTDGQPGHDVASGRVGQGGEHPGELVASGGFVLVFNHLVQYHTPVSAVYSTTKLKKARDDQGGIRILGGIRLGFRDDPRPDPDLERTHRCLSAGRPVIPMMTKPSLRVIVVPVNVPLDGRAIAQLCAVVRDVLGDGAVETLACDLAAIADPDLSLIDALARMQLTARVAGGAIELRHPCPEVRDLLALTGLGGVLPLAVESEPER